MEFRVQFFAGHERQIFHADRIECSGRNQVIDQINSIKFEVEGFEHPCVHQLLGVLFHLGEVQHSAFLQSRRSLQFLIGILWSALELDGLGQKLLRGNR